LEKGFVTGELTFIRKDESKFIGQFTSSLFDDENCETWTAIIIRDVTESKKLERKLKEANDKLKDLAYIDYLTGVLNRRALIDRLGQEMKRSKREFKPLSIILLDIDAFKEINDTYGHITGDQVLKAFARSIKESLRTYDILGRFGGDEFLICLPDTDFDSAIDIAERIRKNIAKIEVQKGDVVIKLSSSAGITYYDHNSIEDLDTLISKVDYIMYRSKEKKNSIYTSI
jgi:diguanylate cyclase (GGDEF)-like protein